MNLQAPHRNRFLSSCKTIEEGVCVCVLVVCVVCECV